jgi:hypothetical protein
MILHGGESSDVALYSFCSVLFSLDRHLLCGIICMFPGLDDDKTHFDKEFCFVFLRSMSKVRRISLFVNLFSV